MKVLGIIPARMSATRFPGKPMEKILGIPMIGHCYFRARLSSLINDLYIATCDKIIYDYIISVGGKAVMTSDKHERATERTAEALKIIESEKSINYDIIVMMQGDEPLVDPTMIDDSIKPLIYDKKQVTNLMRRIDNLDEVNNPNNVKVVIDSKGNSIYMSREPIPSAKKFEKKIEFYRQLGIISFTRNALIKFIKLETSSLEIIESIDMNRFIENRIPIFMVETKSEVDAVDTPIDLKRVTNKMKKDKLFQHYKK
tara:strand:+ start:34442 stop:35209 length:768 start_codon:yes stop_codon:yes gene_type:complete